MSAKPPEARVFHALEGGVFLIGPIDARWPTGTRVTIPANPERGRPEPVIAEVYGRNPDGSMRARLVE